MAAPTFVQSQTGTSSGTDTATAALTGVTGGHALLVGISQGASAVRTYTVTDTAGNTYTLAVENDVTGRYSAIVSATNVTGGDLTITVTASGGVDFTIIAIETTPVSAVGQTGSHDETVNTQAHTDSDVGLSDTDAFWLGVGTLTANGSTLTPGTGWTDGGAGSMQTLFQYRSADGPLTTDGPWTSGVSRQGPHVLAAFQGAGGGGGGTSHRPSTRLLLGMG